MLYLISKHDISLQSKSSDSSPTPATLSFATFETSPIRGEVLPLDRELAHVIYFNQWPSRPLQSEIQLNPLEQTWAQTTARNQGLDQQFEAESCVESQLTYRHMNKCKWPFLILSATDFGDNLLYNKSD